MHRITRRHFVKVAAAAISSPGAVAEAVQRRRNSICVFTKPFQSLSYDDMADRIAELGFDGIEAPIRDGGHIEPE